ncbi:MAG: hypothetical protein Q4F67_09705 [Propionibacteriaceae bacterium]|nr:hypothetical protein [Propionibacteriaceae bacterium]
MGISPRRAAGPLPERTGRSWEESRVGFLSEPRPSRAYAEPVEDDWTADNPVEDWTGSDLFADPWADPLPVAGDETAARARHTAGWPIDEPAEQAWPVAETAPEPEPGPERLAGADLEVLQSEHAARRATRRRRLRLGALVGGLTLLVSAGSALIPNALESLAAMPAQPSPAAKPETDAEPEPARALAPIAQGQIDGKPNEAKPGVIRELHVARIAGIPDPCTTDLTITDAMSAAEITQRAEEQWGFQLTGPHWREDDYRPVVKLFAETLDSVDCTDYLDRVKAGNGGSLEISSLPTRSWAWGDYGLTRPNVLTLDFAKFKEGYAQGDRGRLVRLIIHEMAHSLNADRFSAPPYWTAYNQVWNTNGPVSSYGSTATESFADAVGYYVARCAADNPYDSRQHAAYYDYVKSQIFGDREFGTAIGTAQQCLVKGR